MQIYCIVSTGHNSLATSRIPSFLLEAGKAGGGGFGWEGGEKGRSSHARRFTLLPGDRRPPSTSQSVAGKNRPLLSDWSAAPGNSLCYQWPCHCVVWQGWSQLYCPCSLCRPLFCSRHVTSTTHTHPHMHKSPARLPQNVTGDWGSLGIRRPDTHSNETALRMVWWGLCGKIKTSLCPPTDLNQTKTTCLRSTIFYRFNIVQFVFVSSAIT